MVAMPLDLVPTLVYVLAIARITALITVDTLTESLRDRALTWLDNRPGTLGYYVSTLITCQWCASMWVAGVIVPIVWHYGTNPWVLGIGLALAASQVTGMLSEMGR